MASWEGPR